VTGEAGNEEFASWYVRDFGRVCAAVSLALRDPGLGEEATAEAFARALLHWGKVRVADSPNGWVFRVALNHARSVLRRKHLERRYLQRQRVAAVPPPREPDNELWRAVAALPDRMRTAIALRYVADLSEDEVARAMGVTRGTVASTLYRARQRLAVTLTPDTTRRTP
jgi:RNA polymerase sigma factor (sigma-70 family)